MYDDVIVTSHWLDRMSAVLKANPDCGAVGPVGYNVVDRQRCVERKAYTNIREMVAVVAEYAVKNRGQVLPSLFLDAFCILLERNTLAVRNGLNENYISPAMALMAMTIDITKSGKFCLADREVWLHNAEYTVTSIPEEEDRRCFKAEFGFELAYSTLIRYDVLGMADLDKEGLNILDIGCACGGNMMHIRDINPTAQLYGVELSKGAAAIAQNFGQVWQADILTMDIHKFSNKFDYIIMSDVLEHIVDTDAALDRVYDWLKPGGQFLVSVPNISHISIIGQMLQGEFKYKDSGILDRTHVRFFTNKEMEGLLKAHGLEIRKCRCTQIQCDSKLSALKSELLDLKILKVDAMDLDVFQWKFAAEKV